MAFDPNNQGPQQGNMMGSEKVVNLVDILISEPNGPTLPISVAGVGVVPLPEIPAGTIAVIINNPGAEVNIAFGETATANLGLTFGAGSNPALTSPEQIAEASIYWKAACAGACVQPFK
jgi:hypothetical protein